MTTHNGKRITQRGGMNGEYGKVYVPFDKSVGNVHDVRGVENTLKQSRDSFSATKPEPYLAEHSEIPPLSDNPFRENRLS